MFIWNSVIPIEIWLKYKSVSRLLGTYLDTQIFKIGPPSQKLQCLPGLVYPYLCKFVQTKSQNNQCDKKKSPSVTFERVDQFWKFECLNRCQGGEKYFCSSVKFWLVIPLLQYLQKIFNLNQFFCKYWIGQPIQKLCCPPVQHYLLKIALFSKIVIFSKIA